jgi:predicted secreted protein
LKAQGIIKTKNDLFIPEKNIEAGKFILAYYSYKTNHDIEKTLYLYSGKDKKYPKKILSKMR